MRNVLRNTSKCTRISKYFNVFSIIYFFRSKLILFPVHQKSKLRAGEATEEERKVATQQTGEVLPIRRQPVLRTKARVPTEEEKNFNAYVTLR